MSEATAPQAMVYTTLFEQRAETGDAVTDHIALLNALGGKGKVKRISGGYEIRRVVEKEESTAFDYISGFDRLPSAPVQPWGSLIYSWSTAVQGIIADGTSIRKNKGSKTQLIDYLEGLIKNARKTLKNKINADISSDGTGYAGRAFNGLQNLVPDDPTTGTIGGQDRSTATWARSVKYAFAADLSQTRSAANYQEALLNAEVQTMLNDEGVDLYLATNTHWSTYYRSLPVALRSAKTDGVGSSGFKTLDRNGNDFVLIGGKGGISGNRTYGIATDTMEFIAHNDLYFESLGGQRIPVDQDAVQQYIAIMGQLVGNCPDRNFVLID